MKTTTRDKLRSGQRAMILQILAAGELLTTAAISERTPWACLTVRRQLEKLLADGAVRHVRGARDSRWQITQ